MKKIGVLTSGGDSPGMNAVIRAVVRKSMYLNIEVVGIKRGFAGLIEGDMKSMHLGSVADIIHRGGTILLTARSKEFETTEGRFQAYQNCQKNGLQGLVIIGGDGSFRGGYEFHREYGIPVICIPGTIDNDINGTDMTIGFDTAVNNVVDAVNKIRDTATSHERTFIIEVMGRKSGNIALAAGLAGGAETIVVPEEPVSIDDICDKLEQGYRRGKLHSIIMVAEGAASGLEIGKKIKEKTGFDTKVTILGHIQRGGTPTAYDRILASKMGAMAVDLLNKGEKCKMVGIRSNKLMALDLKKTFTRKKTFDLEAYQLAKILSI